MEFDWEKWPSRPGCSLIKREVEESFEDPFAVRLFPDAPHFEKNARFFNLGRSAKGAGIFSIYRANGKQIKVVHARLFVAEETFFYEKQQEKLLSHGGAV